MGFVIIKWIVSLRAGDKQTHGDSTLCATICPHLTVLQFRTIADAVWIFDSKFVAERKRRAILNSLPGCPRSVERKLIRLFETSALEKISGVLRRRDGSQEFETVFLRLDS